MPPRGPPTHGNHGAITICLLSWPNPHESTSFSPALMSGSVSSFTESFLSWAVGLLKVRICADSVHSVSPGPRTAPGTQQELNKHLMNEQSDEEETRNPHSAFTLASGRDGSIMAFLFTVVFLSSVVPSAPTPAPEAIVHDLPDSDTANHSPQAPGSPRLKPCRTEISIPSPETGTGIQRAHVALCCWVHSLVKRIPGSRGNGLEGGDQRRKHKTEREEAEGRLGGDGEFLHPPETWPSQSTVFLQNPPWVA